MITREEYHKKIRKEHQQKTSTKNNVSDSIDMNAFSDNMADGFHQVLNICMHFIKYCWNAINNISFIRKYNQKQTESFKRDQNFMESQWHPSQKHVAHKKLQYPHKSHVVQSNKSKFKAVSHKNIKAPDDSNENVSHRLHLRKSVPLDKPFMRMMQRK